MSSRQVTKKRNFVPYKPRSRIVIEEEKCNKEDDGHPNSIEKAPLSPSSPIFVRQQSSAMFSIPPKHPSSVMSLFSSTKSVVVPNALGHISPNSTPPNKELGNSSRSIQEESVAIDESTQPSFHSPRTQHKIVLAQSKATAIPVDSEHAFFDVEQPSTITAFLSGRHQPLQTGGNDVPTCTESEKPMIVEENHLKEERDEEEIPRRDHQIPSKRSSLMSSLRDSFQNTLRRVSASSNPMEIARRSSLFESMDPSAQQMSLETIDVEDEEALIAENIHYLVEKFSKKLVACSSQQHIVLEREENTERGLDVIQEHTETDERRRGSKEEHRQDIDFEAVDVNAFLHAVFDRSHHHHSHHHSHHSHHSQQPIQHPALPQPSSLSHSVSIDSATS